MTVPRREAAAAKEVRMTPAEAIEKEIEREEKELKEFEDDAKEFAKKNFGKTDRETLEQMIDLARRVLSRRDELDGKRLALAAAGAPLVATMTTVMLASPSSAAPQPVKAAVVRQASSGHVFRTLHTGLRVRKRPSTSAKIVDVLGAVGSKVTVNCFTHGSTVFGNNVWYHIVKPHNGFVAGFYLGTGGDPAAGIRRC